MYIYTCMYVYMYMYTYIIKYVYIYHYLQIMIRISLFANNYAYMFHIIRWERVQ